VPDKTTVLPEASFASQNLDRYISGQQQLDAISIQDTDLLTDMPSESFADVTASEFALFEQLVPYFPE